MEAALSHCGATSTQRGRSSPAAFGLRKALADDENRQTSKPCPSLLPGTRWLAAGGGGLGGTSGGPCCLCCHTVARGGSARAAAGGRWSDSYSCLSYSASLRVAAGK